MQPLTRNLTNVRAAAALALALSTGAAALPSGDTSPLGKVTASVAPSTAQASIAPFPGLWLPRVMCAGVLRKTSSCGYRAPLA